MNQRNAFGCFDPESECHVTTGDLPHWFQAGAAMFVTFRSHDSMPREVLERRRRVLLDALIRDGLSPQLAQRVVALEKVDHARIQHLPERTRFEFRRLCDRTWHITLDGCHGACLLREKSLAQIVAGAIKHYDGAKYDLDRIVVMPNHVHVIVQFRQSESLDVLSQSWLRFSARQINKTTGRQGCFWQGEPFDHLIRSEAQFRYLQRYIDENPAKANLPDGDFLLWKRES